MDAASTSTSTSTSTPTPNPHPGGIDRAWHRLVDEVGRFDAAAPIERAYTPPASWYVDPAFDALDRVHVFGRSWQLACRADQVDAPGRFVAGRAFGLSWVVVRGADGVLRGFANTCRHKATEVCAGEGHAEHFTCPYHGWTYRLDGSLRTAPRMAGIEALDRGEMALPQLGVEVWGPLVMIHPDRAAAEAHPFGEGVRALGEALDRSGWESLRWCGSRTWDVACNWKAYVDNYLDGGYHIAHMHPGLAAQLDLDSYRTELHARHNVQTCGGSAATALPGRTEGGALYAWVHPNLMLNRYGPCLDTNYVVPLTARTCRVRFDFWFTEALARDAAWVARSLDDAERTQREDMDVSERVQIGMETGTWSHGRYAPRVELGAHHFHRLLAEDLRTGLERVRPR